MYQHTVKTYFYLNIVARNLRIINSHEPILEMLKNMSSLIRLAYFILPWRTANQPPSIISTSTPPHYLRLLPICFLLYLDNLYNATSLFTFKHHQRAPATTYTGPYSRRDTSHHHNKRASRPFPTPPQIAKSNDSLCR